jgi:hypothetical protein
MGEWLTIYVFPSYTSGREIHGHNNDMGAGKKYRYRHHVRDDKKRKTEDGLRDDNSERAQGPLPANNNNDTLAAPQNDDEAPAPHNDGIEKNHLSDLDKRDLY